MVWNNVEVVTVFWSLLVSRGYLELIVTQQLMEHTLIVFFFWMIPGEGVVCRTGYR